MTTTAPEATAENIAAISDTERCDRCGHRAYVLVHFNSGRLAFCAHDYNRNEATITAMPDAIVLDNRGALNPKR